MPEKQKHKFEPNQRVRLLGDPSNLYPAAPALSEGWVRKRSHDEYGYPMVYIEWDKTHWTYNGEQDEWTLEAHFEPVEEEKKMDGSKDMEDLMRLLGRLTEESSVPAKGEKGERDILSELGTSVNWPSKEEYLDMLTKGTEDARSANAFVLIAIHPHENGDLVPILTSAFMTPESAILLEAQLSRIGALAHGEIASTLIALLMQHQEKKKNG
jgi:hypothetical protein